MLKSTLITDPPFVPCVELTSDKGQEEIVSSLESFIKSRLPDRYSKAAKELIELTEKGLPVISATEYQFALLDFLPQFSVRK